MQAVTTTLRRSLGLAALLFLSSCDLEFPEQEVHFRHDVEADRLDVLFVVKGLSAEEPGDQAVEKGVAAAERVLAGRREFMILDWPWYIDYEEMIERSRQLESEARAAGDSFPEDQRGALVEARHFLGVADLVQVTKVGLYEDAEGRLCGYQLARIEQLSRFLGWLNGVISRDMLQMEADGKLLREVEGDEETAKRWAAKARAGTPWVTMQDGAFVVDVPLSEKLMSGGIALMFQEVMDAGEQGRWMLSVFAEFLRHTQAVQMGDQGLTVSVGHSSGTTVMNPVHPDRTYHPSLAQALAAKGMVPDKDLTVEQIRGFLPGRKAPGSAH